MASKVNVTSSSGGCSAVNGQSMPQHKPSTGDVKSDFEHLTDVLRALQLQRELHQIERDAIQYVSARRHAAQQEESRTSPAAASSAAPQRVTSPSLEAVTLSLTSRITALEAALKGLQERQKGSLQGFSLKDIDTSTRKSTSRTLPEKADLAPHGTASHQRGLAPNSNFSKAAEQFYALIDRLAEKDTDDDESMEPSEKGGVPTPPDTLQHHTIYPCRTAGNTPGRASSASNRSPQPPTESGTSGVPAATVPLTALRREGPAGSPSLLHTGGDRQGENSSLHYPSLASVKENRGDSVCPAAPNVPDAPTTHAAQMPVGAKSLPPDGGRGGLRPRFCPNTDEEDHSESDSETTLELLRKAGEAGDPTPASFTDPHTQSPLTLYQTKEGKYYYWKEIPSSATGDAAAPRKEICFLSRREVRTLGPCRPCGG